MAGLRDIFGRALKTKRSTAYLFVKHSDADPEAATGDADSHIVELQGDHRGLLEKNTGRRTLVRSCTQVSLDPTQYPSKFSRKEVNELYREFKHECPSGYVSKDRFQSLYQKCYPLGGSERYAGYVFDTFNQDHNGHVTFPSFLQGMSILSRGSTEEKLKWIFTLYDIDKNGYITKNELVEIVSAVYEMRCSTLHGQRHILDTDAVLNHAANIFQKMDINEDGIVSFDEFAQACRSDDDIRRTIGSLNGGLHPRLSNRNL